MTKSNAQILFDVRETMKLMLSSAQSENWDEVTVLDKERTGLLSDLSKTEYTGELELIDEIIRLDQKILEAATRAKSELNDKVSLACRSREVHNEYQTISDL